MHNPQLLVLRERLAAFGLNVVGVAAPDVYDAGVPPAQAARQVFAATRAIIVVASGGPALWQAFLDDLRAQPRHLLDEPHPLDAFVQRSVGGVDADWTVAQRRWVFAAASEPIAVDFRVLGEAAGIGGRSRLQLLMHPMHGTWLGLRAACFIDAPLAADRPGAADVCAQCPAPCMSACPGAAFTSGSWDVDACAEFHTQSAVCEKSCQARLACPVGVASRYPLEERTYHYNRRVGRQWLRRELGVHASSDRHEGLGPHWASWRSVREPRE